MAMKCPNCGKETSEDRFFCGWCNAKLREPTPSTDSPTYRSEPESSSQMELDDRSLGRTVSKAQIFVIVLLALSIVACLLPWVTANVSTEEQDIATTNSGYEYIVPLGAKYSAPVAILSVIGFVLIAYSFKATDRARMLIVLGGILIIVGAAAAFIYTTSAAMSDTSGSLSYSVDVEGRYGMGLGVILGILTIVVGARTEF